jgi:uncharacterized protein
VVAHLTKLFVIGMLERNFGYVLLVSSIGGYQPSPTFVSYSAAKGFRLNMGEALNYELRKPGVGVTIFPGFLDALKVWSNRLIPRRTSAVVSELLIEAGQR